MINDSTLAMLRCPQNQSPLQAADPGLVARLNAAISAGRVRNQVGEAVRETIDGALIRSDGELVYPIVDEIPVLLADEAIPLAQL